MVPSEEFLRHAAECKSMAKFAHDPADKAVWSRMAERWSRCAVLAKDHEPVMQMTKARARRNAALAD